MTSYTQTEEAPERIRVEEDDGTHGPIRTYRDLIVWQKAMQLVTVVYELSSRFPQSEPFGLTGQLRRSAISIPGNIAEGYGRRATGDYRRMLQISMGSLFELQTQIAISTNLGYSSRADARSVWAPSRQIARMLSSLIRRLHS